jgi:hypothetical protein
LEEDGTLEFQVQDPRAGNKHRGGSQVTTRYSDPAQLLADGGMTHQQFCQDVVEMVPARDAAGFVEQPDGRAVAQPGAFRPRHCPQRQRQRLGVTCAPGLGNERLRDRAKPVRVSRHIKVSLPGTYHQAVRRLCPSGSPVVGRAWRPHGVRFIII